MPSTRTRKGSTPIRTRRTKRHVPIQDKRFAKGVIAYDKANQQFIDDLIENLPHQTIHFWRQLAAYRDISPTQLLTKAVYEGKDNLQVLKDNFAPTLKQRKDEEHSGRLNMAIAREIRERYAKGDCTQAALAEEYGVTDNAVSKIVRYASYRE